MTFGLEKALLALLLLVGPASTAWGAGDASEERCDSPGSGVTCLCSEPLTADEGVHSDPGTGFNPTSTNGCFGNGNSVHGLTGAQVARSVLASSLANPMTVGGSGHVMEFEAGGAWNVGDITRDFTQGTYCSRHYAYYDETYECPGGAWECNIKALRLDNSGGGNTVGIQSSTFGGEWSIYWAYFSSTNMGGCAAAGNSTGCAPGGDPGSHWRSINPDGLDFEGTDGAWVRWELCFDHNLTQQHVDDANAAFGSAITWPGVNHVYGRLRHTVITGPNQGKSRMWGPAWGEHSVSSISTGTRSWLATSRTGSPNSFIVGHYRTAYNMVVRKTSADPLYWIGPAVEVEGGGSPDSTAPAAPTNLLVQ